MHDLKVYEQSRRNLEGTVTIVEEVSEALGMMLVLSKCSVVQGRWSLEGVGLSKRWPMVAQLFGTRQIDEPERNTFKTSSSLDSS